MAKRRASDESASTEQLPSAASPTPVDTGQPTTPAETGSAASPGDRLQQAQDKLARMEETNRICFRHRSDYGRIEEELQQFRYSQAELDHILEPKGPKNIPGFGYFEMKAQRSFIDRLSKRSSGTDIHTAVVAQSRQNENDEIAF